MFMQLSSTSFGSAAHEILMKPHTTIPIYHCISISTITENIKSTTASTSSTSNCIWACPTRLKTCKNNNFLSLSSYCTVVAAVLYRLSLSAKHYSFCLMFHMPTPTVTVQRVYASGVKRLSLPPTHPVCQTECSSLQTFRTLPSASVPDQ